jgi:hypothetical protein
MLDAVDTYLGLRARAFLARHPSRPRGDHQRLEGRRDRRPEPVLLNA